MFFSYIAYAGYTFFKGLQKASPTEKNQLRYVAAASIIGFVGRLNNIFSLFSISIFIQLGIFLFL